jgi:Type II secretion system (T2SS), protein E, N-terminal domain
MSKLTQLGEILVEMGACERQRVAEALDNQVVFGGRLGTNLLELGAVTEDVLARALARRYSVASLHGDLSPDPQAIALVKPGQADRLEIVPYELAGRRLTVLCCDPSDLGKFDDLAFALDKNVVPVVVPEARLWALLRTHYGAGRPRRGVEVDVARPRAESPNSREVEPREDLMDEAQFASLYQNRRPTPPPVEARDVGSAVRRLPPWPDRNARAPAGVRGSPPEVQLPAASRRPEPSETLAEPSEVEVPEPLSFAEAVRALSGVTDRDAIARIVIRYARSYFRRVVLLTVHARGLDGWEGLGEGLSPGMVARLHVPFGKPGFLQTVVESRSHLLGPLSRTEANVRLLRALGGGVPENAFAMPILARGNVVNVLYADDGRGRPVNLEGLSELLILATRISQTYDVLLDRER